MINSSSDLIKGINRHLNASKKAVFSANGVAVSLNERYGKYLGCKIDGRQYRLLFQEEIINSPDKCFIHLCDDNRDKPSIVQFTIDKSNFSIEKNDFQLIQNRGTTIGKRINGFEAEFKKLMIKNGFNKNNIVIQGCCKKTDYESILSQLLLWLRLRVKTKLQLEEKYRNIEDRTSETESNLDLDDVGDIESRTEGGKKVVISVRAERDSKFRAEAIKIHGLVCIACGFDFQKVYGNWGKDFIEVHHVIPLADGKKRETNPKNDLTVVCSNCHRMIHRKKNIVLTVDELKTKLMGMKNISC